MLLGATHKYKLHLFAHLLSWLVFKAEGNPWIFLVLKLQSSNHQTLDLKRLLKYYLDSFIRYLLAEIPNGFFSIKVPLWTLNVKFIYSEKAKKVCEIFTLLLTTVHTVKIKVKNSQNVVAFSEYLSLTFNKLKQVII